MQTLHAFSTPATPPLQLDASFQSCDRLVKSLFAVHPQPMWLYCATSLRILAANGAAERFYGCSAQALCGMSAGELVLSRYTALGAAGEKASTAFHWNCLTGPVAARLDAIRVRVAERTAVLVVVTPPSGDGPFARYGDAGTFFSAFFTCSPTAIVVVDARNRAVNANMEFRRQFECPLDAIRGRPVVPSDGPEPDVLHGWREGDRLPVSVTALALVRKRPAVAFKDRGPHLRLRG